MYGGSRRGRLRSPRRSTGTTGRDMGRLPPVTYDGERERDGGNIEVTLTAEKDFGIGEV